MSPQVEELQELRRWYSGGLARRIHQLENAEEEFQQNRDAGIESIRRLAHSLRGSGTTCGFPEITSAAASIEDADETEIHERLGMLLNLLNEIHEREEVRLDGDRVVAREPSEQPRHRVREGEGALAQKHGILIIDDDEDVRDLLGQQFSTSDGIVHLADSAEAAEKILAENEISLIILDLLLPDRDGRALLADLHKRLSTSHLPIFVLSGLSGTDVTAECFALGAEGVFAKPFDLSQLAAAVSARLERLERDSRETRCDFLSGLPNRAAFCEAFERAASLCARAKQPLSVAKLDFDSFKNINGAQGRAVGDFVLREAAALIGRAFRGSDLMARWGGEEFAVLFPNTDAQGAGRAMGAALKALHEAVFQTPGGEPLSVTISAGVAQWSGVGDVEDILAEADGNRHAAKNQGRDRVVVGAPPVSTRKKRILIADDDELVSDVLNYRLQRDGFDPIPVKDGSEVIPVALQSDVSMIVLDVKMPQVDGFEILSRIRRLPALQHIPIVMLTAMGSEADIVRGIDLGAADYVVKPFSLTELLARIHRLVKQR